MSGFNSDGHYIYYFGQEFHRRNGVALIINKSLKYSTWVQPQNGQNELGLLPRPWDSPGKNTGVGCHFLLQCMKVKSESEVAQSCPTVTPWTAAFQAPPSIRYILGLIYHQEHTKKT